MQLRPSNCALNAYDVSTVLMECVADDRVGALSKDSACRIAVDNVVGQRRIACLHADVVRIDNVPMSRPADDLKASSDVVVDAIPGRTRTGVNPIPVTGYDVVRDGSSAAGVDGVVVQSKVTVNGIANDLNVSRCRDS